MITTFCNSSDIERSNSFAIFINQHSILKSLDLLQIDKTFIDDVHIWQNRKIYFKCNKSNRISRAVGFHLDNIDDGD